jgi:RNA polymerase sigma factor (sigma-70 family)
VSDEAHDYDQVCRELGAVLSRAIVAYAGGRADIADDAVAEAFARAIERDGQVRDPKAYLYRVSFRIAAAELRRRTEAPLEEVVEDVLPLADLGPALRQLSPAQRAAIFLYYEADKPVPEVARLMGTSSAAVRVHLMRDRRRLAELLREGNDDA